MSDLDLSVLRGIAEAARREGTLLHLSDGEWRDFQSIPDHGYSHRAWVDQKIIGRCDSLLSRLEAAEKVIAEALDVFRPGASVPLGVSEARHVDRLLAEGHRILSAYTKGTDRD